MPTYAAKTAAEAQHLVRLLEQAGYTPTLTITATKATVSTAAPSKVWREVLSKFRRQWELREAADRYLNKMKQEELI